MALTTDTVILRAAIALALERGLDFAPEGFVDVDGTTVSPVEFASLVAARLAAPADAVSEDTPPVPVPERAGVRVLRAIVRARQSMMTRLLAEAEHAYESALRTAGLKVISRARSRTGKQRTAAVCSAVDHRDPLGPWLAAVGVTEMEMLDHAFDTFRTRATKELTRYQDRVLALSERGGLALDARRFQVEDAVKVLVAGLTAMARARLLHGDEAMMAASKIPDVPRAVRSAPSGGGFDLPGMPNPDELSRAAARLVRNATNVVEGNASFRLPTTGDGMPDVIVDRSSPDLLEELSTEFTVSPLWTWVHGFYGEPLTDFPSHIELDGIETTDRDTDDLLVNPEAFPPDEYLFPGDHDGCTCEWIPIEGEAPEEAAPPEEPMPPEPEPALPEPEPVVPEPEPEPPPPPEPTPEERVAQAEAEDIQRVLDLAQPWQTMRAPEGADLDVKTQTNREAFAASGQYMRDTIEGGAYTNLEQEGLFAYHGESYEFINDALRGGETPVQLSQSKDILGAMVEEFLFDEDMDVAEALAELPWKNDFEVVSSIDDAIAKRQLTDDTMVFRTIDKNVVDQLERGTEFTDKGYVSTALWRYGYVGTVENTRDATMIIRLPAGTRVAAENAETELTLARGSTFRVLGTAPDPTGATAKFVYAELITG